MAAMWGWFSEARVCASRSKRAAEMAGDNVRGIEAVVGRDGTLVRINIYSAEAAMGMMLLERGTLDVTFTNDTLAGTLSIERPLQEARVDKAIAYTVSFLAPIERSRHREAMGVRARHLVAVFA